MRILLLSLIFACFLHSLQADNCCKKSDCGDSCPWNDACNDGFDFDCMDRIAGPFKCRDYSKCHTIAECDDHAAALRSGQICNGFPAFNGGYPFDEIKFDNEHEDYGCEIPSENGKYCSQWYTRENSIDEFELGTATCDEESTNGNYCQTWSIAQTEYKKCWLVWDEGDDDSSAGYVTTCCSKSNNSHGCCQSLCSPSFYNAREVQYEYADCHCLTPSDNGEYCSQWYCEEYAYASMTFDQGREQEKYQCNLPSPNALYCSRWSGDIDSREEFEMSDCRCSAEETVSPAGNYCAVWFCQENGVDYWWPNTLWNLFSGIMGLPVVVLTMVFAQEALESVIVLATVLLFWVVWGGSFVVIGVWKAGVSVLVCAGLVLYSLSALVLFVAYRRQVSENEKVNAGKRELVAPSELELNEFERRVVVEGVKDSYPTFHRPAAKIVLGSRPIISSAPLEENNGIEDNDNPYPTASVVVTLHPDLEETAIEGDEGDLDGARRKMKKLKVFLEEGLITHEVYDAQVLALLNKL